MPDTINNQIAKTFYRCSGRECWQLVEAQGQKCEHCSKPKIWQQLKINAQRMNPYLPADRQNVGNEPLNDNDDDAN